MGHLVLQAEQLLLKVLNLHLQMAHRSLSVLDDPLEVFYLQFKVFNFTVEVLVRLDDAFFLFVEKLVGAISLLNLLLMFFLLPLHAHNCILAHLFLFEMAQDLLTKHRVKLVALVVGQIDHLSSNSANSRSEVDRGTVVLRGCHCLGTRVAAYAAEG